MNEYDEVLELEAPHGFLVAQEKQTAIARVEPLDIEKSYLIACNGEAFGVAAFEQPAQVKTKEFDSDEWLNQHRVTPRERRQWWPESEAFYVYRLADWRPFEALKLYENGQVTDEPRLTGRQWDIVSKAKDLPKQIIIQDDFMQMTCDYVALCGDKSFYNRELRTVVNATFDKAIECGELTEDADVISVYSLALVRNPRMRVSKKNCPEAAKAEVEIEITTEDEDDDMPYRIRERDGEYCVVKVEPDDSDGDTEGCHATREEAMAQLAALNINVVAEEESSKKGILLSSGDLGESWQEVTQPEKPEPNFMQRLKLAAKNIIDLVTLAEREQKEVKADILTSNYGVTQKEVNGDLWHFTWSTNAFEDREKEIFSTHSLKQYVDQAAKSGERGFFNFWHMQGTDFARKEWQMVIGRFLVEAGPYLDNQAGKAAKQFFAKYNGSHPEIAPEGWGCSPEFRYLPEERATGTYENIWITRTSTLPRMAAANIWTETSQLARSKMAITDYSEDQIKAAIEVFKDEEFVKTLIQQGENKTAELEAAGVAHKANGDPEPEPEPEPVEVQLNMEELAAEVGKQLSANFEPIAEAITTMAGSIKTLQERLDAVEKAGKIKAVTESPRFVFNLQRAIDNEATVVTEDDKLSKAKPVETDAKSDPWSQVFNK